MRTRSAILHIGTEKTGSTSIQNMLADGREELLSRGFAFPKAPGERNHIRLALYAGESRNTKALARRENLATGQAGDIRDWFPGALEAELRAMPESVHTVLFSNEHCHSRLVTEASVARLHALLGRFFDDIRIIVYLRRQDELAVSRYSTMLRTGGFSEEIFPPGAETKAYYDYAALLDRWGSAFGRAALRPRLFGREHFRQGDLLCDFLEECGVGPIPVADSDLARNPSLIPAAQEFLLRFNRTFDRDADRRRPAWVAGFMNAHFAGPGRLPPRREAEAFHAAFTASNERVRAAFFPDRASLFGTDFTRYPEELAPVPDAEVLEVALAVVAHLSVQPESRAARLAAQREAAVEAAIEAGETPPAPDAREAEEATSLPARTEDERATLRAVLDAEPTNMRALRRLVRLAKRPEEKSVAEGYLEKAKQAAPRKAGLAVLAGKLGQAQAPPAGG